MKKMTKWLAVCAVCVMGSVPAMATDGTEKNSVLQPLVLFIGKLTVIQVVEQQKST